MVDSFLVQSRKFLLVVGRIELALTVFLLFAIVVSIGTQVISRYFFNNPLIWVEEGVVYALIWSVFLGASVGVKAQKHIRIEWLSHQFGPRFALTLFMFRQVAIVLIVVMIFPYALKVMSIESRSMTVSLPWELPRFLFFSLPLNTSFVLIGLTSLYYFVEGLKALPSGGVVDPIMAFADDDFDDVEKLMGST